MSVRERIQRYKSTGAAADLVRVEILVPPESRSQILALAARLRNEHRRAKAARSVNAEEVNDRAKMIIHRLLARRIGSTPELVDQAREVVSQKQAEGRPYHHLDEWHDLLSRDPIDVRRIITQRSNKMKRLRVSSPLAPLAGVEDPELRRRIWRKARLGLARRAS